MWLGYQWPLQWEEVADQVYVGLDEIDGVYWQVKKAAPRLPSRNKDGKMSRRAMVTTWEVYKGALLEAGLDPADYEDMRDKLSDKESVNYWQMKMNYYYSPHIMANITAAAKQQAEAIQSACIGQGPFTTNLNYYFRSYANRSLCTALLYDEAAAQFLLTP